VPVSYGLPIEIYRRFTAVEYSADWCIAVSQGCFALTDASNVCNFAPYTATTISWLAINCPFMGKEGLENRGKILR